MTATAVVHHNHHHNHHHHNHHQPPPPPPPQTQPQTQALTHPGSYLSITPSDTTRSNTPIKLPLQMPSAAATTTTTSTTTTVTTTTPPRSWLGDPDDVPLDNLRRSQQQQQHQQPQNPAPTLQLTPVAATTATHPSIGDEESRPPSHESEWNSTHPCYPHRNPYVPLDSALYASTRIIRISRDYMVYGDLAPAYSNVFPDILEPHVTEEQFRVVIARINAEMRRAFDPWNVWNWVDALVGLVTLWLWEEIVDTHCKRVLRGVEEYLEGRNREMERSGQKAVFVPLRRSGYMNLDIQIPDPIPATDEDEQEESKYLDGDASDTGSTIGPLGSEAGHQSLRMNSMNGRIGSSGRIGSMGSSSEGGYR